MIKFRFEKKEWQVVTPTIFPDGTSQIWKLDMPNFAEMANQSATIKWNFESENEIIQVMQLAQLLNTYVGRVFLHLPYLPYARQDKKILNDTTFALATFFEFVVDSKLFYVVHVYDMHNLNFVNGWKLVNKTPHHFLEAIQDFRPDTIFFPDEGAFLRYSKLFANDTVFNMYPKMYGNKVRNQATGEITDYKITTFKDYHTNERILMCDDICDGGATFVSAAKELHKLKVGDIGLCVSHGIFSKGLAPLAEAGISHVYTTDSFIKNGISELDNKYNYVTVYPV